MTRNVSKGRESINKQGAGRKRKKGEKTGKEREIVYVKSKDGAMQREKG